MSTLRIVLCFLLIFMSGIVCYSKPFNVGIMLGGDYIRYKEDVIGIIDSLKHKGFIEKEFILPQEFRNKSIISLRPIIEYYNIGAKKNIIDFPLKYFWDCEWEEDDCELVDDVITRLKEGKDLPDVILGIGLIGAEYLLSVKHSVPILVMSSSDPIGAGISKSIDDSGRDNLVAPHDPFKHSRQIELYHSIYPFKRLGVSYENSRYGEIYAAKREIDELSKELGFEVVVCFSIDDDNIESVQSLLKCHKEMAKKGIDAIYLIGHNGLQYPYLPMLFQPLYESKVRIFVQDDPFLVQYGALFAIDNVPSPDIMGGIYSDAIIQIRSGVKPRNIKQLIDKPILKTYFNIEVAYKIGMSKEEIIRLESQSDITFRKVDKIK